MLWRHPDEGGARSGTTPCPAQGSRPSPETDLLGVILITAHERAVMEHLLSGLKEVSPATLVSLTGMDPTTTRIGFATPEQVAFDEMMRGVPYVILPCPFREGVTVTADMLRALGFTVEE